MTQHTKQRVHFSHSFTTSYPAIRTVPAEGRARVARILRSVVLPAPLGPKIPRQQPRLSSSSMPLSAVIVPKCFTTPCRCTIVSVLILLFPASLSPFDLLHFFAVPRSMYKAALYRPDDVADTYHKQLYHARTRYPAELYSVVMSMYGS